MSVVDQGSPAPSLRRMPFTIRLTPNLTNALTALKPEPGVWTGGVSGLLFGVAEESSVLVKAHRPFPKTGGGAGGTGERAQQNKLFEQLLSAAQKDPATASMTMVGWYAVRDQGGLSEADLIYHNWYFPRANDLALVMKPEGGSEVTLELFCRTPSGDLSEASHRVGLVRLGSEPVEAPVEVPLRSKIQDDFFLRAYRLGEAEEEQPRSPGWKDRLSFWRPSGKAASEDGEVKNRVEPPPRTARELDDAFPRPPMGGAATSDNRAVQPRSVELPARAEAKSHSVLRTPEADPPSTSEPVTSPLARLVTPSPPPASPRRADSWPMRILAFAAATALTFAGAYYVRTRNANAMLSQSVQPPATPSGLGLKLEAQGDRLLLSWNRQNALVRHAQSGSLQIDDGPQKRLVSLDAVQVANGAILYHPSSDDVTFRLEVHGIDGTQAIDTMRVLDSAKPAALDLSPEAPVRKSAPSPAGQPAVTIPSSKLDRTPGKTIPETQTPRHEEEIRPPLAEAKASGNAVKTAPVAAPPPSEPVKEATSKPSEEVQAVPEDAPVKPAFTPQLTSPPATSPAISSAPPKAAPLPKVEGTNAPAATRTAPVPAVNKPEISSYQPPRPVRQVLPNVSGLPPSVMAMAGQVEILVKVTAQGNVSDAYPGHTNQKVSAVLVGVALNAAKQWHFQPAVLGGKAVPSEHSIVFQFARPH